MGSVYARSNFRRCLSQYPSARLGNREFSMGAAQNGVLESTAIRDSRPLAWLPRHSVTRRTAKITRY
ncbi:hypothetical protein V9T40_001330 [Parthenolecanium corni]|uniref:Uncharacterized protein n=1 Tax=Parthenolecanium corni TaxID=536013 RepID=A0AAN9TCM6_9HEMI